MDDITVASLRKNARESLRVMLREFKGKRFVDLRVFADNGVEQVATGKGVALKPELLRSTIEALEEAERQAAAQGLFR